MAVHLDLDDLDVGGKETFTFQFDGETYECRSIEEFDARTFGELREAADRDPMAMLEAMVGAEQVERLDQAESVFTLGLMNKVFEAWMAHYEVDEGKSGGSRPSKRTTKPKKR